MTRIVQIRVEKYCYLLARIYVIEIRYVCLADKISVHDKFQLIKDIILYLNISVLNFKLKFEF